MIETMNKPRPGMPGTDGELRRPVATPEAQVHSEGIVARTLEEQTAKLPSDIWLWAALGSMGAALFLRLADKKDESLFVGQWAAPFLLLGVYNKLVKIGGSDRVHD